MLKNNKEIVNFCEFLRLGLLSAEILFLSLIIFFKLFAVRPRQGAQ
jgi:hypothetical protein